MSFFRRLFRGGAVADAAGVVAETLGEGGALDAKGACTFDGGFEELHAQSSAAEISAVPVRPRGNFIVSKVIESERVGCMRCSAQE